MTSPLTTFRQILDDARMPRSMEPGHEGYYLPSNDQAMAFMAEDPRLIEVVAAAMHEIGCSDHPDSTGCRLRHKLTATSLMEVLFR